VQEQHFSLHFVLPLYTIPISCCFGFMPYVLASSFLLNSFSYLIISPPCLTMPRWSFVYPHTCSVAFCCSFIAFRLLSACQLQIVIIIQTFVRRTISASELNLRRPNTSSFSICYQPSKFLFHIGLSQLPFFQPWYVHSLFLPWCRTNDDITNK